MAYRFCNTSKWHDDIWFIDLSSNEKLMFIYLCDNCDCAGFLELSLRRLSFDLGFTPEEIKDCLRNLKKAYILSTDKRVLFLKNFLKHQKNLPLNKANQSHKGILKRFENYKNRFEINPLKDIKIISDKADFNPEIEGLDNRGYSDSIILNELELSESFIDFWNLYNKKQGDKKQCFTKWQKLKPSIQKKILATLPKWKDQFEDSKFQPYPLTYLNQERWNDEIIKTAKTQPKLSIAM